MGKRSREDTPSSSVGHQPKNVMIEFIEVLEVRCEWVDCGFVCKEKEQFLEHVEQHGPHLETRQVDGKDQEWHCCMWECCGFDSEIREIAQFHINYHAFHTRIKALGTQLLNGNPNLECHLDYEGRNLLPVLPAERLCQWIECKFRTNSYQRLLNHVDVHFRGRPVRRRYETVPCEWRDCKRENKDLTKLKSHIRTHIQEKVIGCPVCGAQFASKTKLVDHCSRQIPHEKKKLKCSYCKKTFPSERILRDHIRLHVNVLKCPMCDMSCPYRYTLALHIRYKHLQTRPYKCNFCDHRSVTERDLETHFQTHCSENFWVCEQEGCDYSCRSQNGLSAHYSKAHCEAEREYACHICDARYSLGSHLTAHLKNSHAYRWASGQTRFRYIKDETGLYRLLTVRYESIEVTQEIMENKTGTAVWPRAPKKFTCVSVEPNKLEITEDKREGKNVLMSYEEDTEEDADDLQPIEDYLPSGDEQDGTERNEPVDDDIDHKFIDLDENSGITEKTEEKLEEASDEEAEDFEKSLKIHMGMTESDDAITVIRTNKKDIIKD